MSPGQGAAYPTFTQSCESPNLAADENLLLSNMDGPDYFNNHDPSMKVESMGVDYNSYQSQPTPPDHNHPPPPLQSFPARQPSADSNPHSPPAERKNSQGGAPGLSSRSCVTCRRRKVKCDKKIPCSNCVKAQIQCIFPAPGRISRRPKQGGKVVSEREAELLKRLRRLEGVVEELSGQVELEGVKHSPSSDHSSMHRDGDSHVDSDRKLNHVRVVGMDEGSGTRKSWMSKSFNLGDGPPKTAFSAKRDGQTGRLTLDEGKTQYIASPFWSSITEEVDEIREILEEQGLESDEDGPIIPSTVITDSNHQSFIMGYNSSDVNLKTLHPLPSQIPFYWQTFIDNVQPLVKILHIPTMSKVIKEVQGNLDALSKSTEALMFAVYFATITSMTPDEVRLNFGIEKGYLLKQYRFGVEQALARASFLNTNEIVTVQAFILFLICVRRNDDTRFVWSLTGLAIRLAQGLGLHRDGTNFDLSPFDTEMRRRLWWQVCILDVRAAEDHGSEPSILDSSFDTQYPLSINDSDLDPESTKPPTPRIGVSEMTFCLIRYEISSLARRLNQASMAGSFNAEARSLTIDDKERLIKECSDRMEEKYLQYCEDAGPLCWVAATVARLITAKMSLVIYHPLIQPGKPSSLSQEVKDRLLLASIEIIEYSRILEQEASTKHWGWLFHTYVQWHAIAFILGELCVRAPSPMVERAWLAIEGIFSDWGGVIAKTKTGMLWQPMRKLMAKARRHREETMPNSGPPRPHPSIGPRPPPPNKATPPGYSLAADRLTSASPESSTAHIPSPNSWLTAGSSDPRSMPSQGLNMPLSYPPPQQQQMPQGQAPGMQSTPWLLDDSTLLDLDMQGLEGDVNWEGWDEMVRDFQMVDGEGQLPEGAGRGPGTGLNGMSSWW